MELVPFHVPLKPNVVDPPAPREPLCGALRTACEAPFGVSTPFQSWVMVWPLANVHRTVQLLMAELPARTVTVAPNPPGHWLSIRYVAEQAPGGVLGGELLLDGGLLGGDELAGGLVGGPSGGGATPLARLNASCARIDP